jgi:hypothetical protein
VKIFDNDNLILDVTHFVRDWIALLAEGKFEVAINQLDASLENGVSIWNVESLKAVFLEYWKGEMPIINNPYQMDMRKEEIEFYHFDNGSGLAIDYLVPLENNWGDLTAQFSFVKNEGNFYYVYLTDIHVL